MITAFSQVAMRIYSLQCYQQSFKSFELVYIYIYMSFFFAIEMMKALLTIEYCSCELHLLSRYYYGVLAIDRFRVTFSMQFNIIFIEEKQSTKRITKSPILLTGKGFADEHLIIKGMGTDWSHYWCKQIDQRQSKKSLILLDPN